jgi:hypothetical protein
MSLIKWFGRRFYDDLGVTGLGITTVTVVITLGTAWALWFFWLRGPSCNPPYHDVFTGTSVIYIKGIPVKENDYACVGP